MFCHFLGIICLTWGSKVAELCTRLSKRIFLSKTKSWCQSDFFDVYWGIEVWNLSSFNCLDNHCHNEGCSFLYIRLQTASTVVELYKNISFKTHIKLQLRYRDLPIYFFATKFFSFECYEDLCEFDFFTLAHSTSLYFNFEIQLQIVNVLDRWF